MSEYFKDAEKITVPVTGEPVSIWSGELKNIIYAIDDKIVRALRTALENHTGFEVNAKITFAPTQHNGQTLFAVTYKTNHKFDPIQVEDKAALNDFCRWRSMNTGSLSSRTMQSIRQCLTTKRRNNK